jgi:hypothetical protein
MSSLKYVTFDFGFGLEPARSNILVVRAVEAIPLFSRCIVFLCTEK